MNRDRSKRVRHFILLVVTSSLVFIIILFSPIAFAQPNQTSGFYFPLVLKEWPPNTPTPGPGYLLITEVMYNPSGLEPDGEWVEIYNAGGAPVALAAYKVGDEETPGGREGMFQFPSGAEIAPGQVVIISHRATTFTAIYGFAPDYEFRESDPLVPNMLKYSAWAGGNVEFVNSGDEVFLLDIVDNQVDVISWGSSIGGLIPPIPRVAEGHTLERYPAGVDSDTAGDWRDQSLPDPGKVDTSLPTPTPTATPSLTFTPSMTPTPTQTLIPGVTQTPSPTVTPTSSPTPTPSGSVKLLISEVLFDPQNAEPEGEWIELYNAGDASVGLDGYKLGDEETPGQGEGMLQFPNGVVLAPGEVIIVASSASSFMEAYGFNPDFEMVDTDSAVPDMQKYTPWSTGSVYLNNSGDEVLLLGPDDLWVDAVSWGSSATAFDPPAPQVAEGHSLERHPANVDSDTAGDWRDQATPDPGQVDLSPTPPTPTPTDTPSPTPIPTLVINEIHADPDSSLGDANGDGTVDASDDEFIEIVNDTGSAVDISGWTLNDGIRVRHTFSADTVIPGGCAILVFGGGTPTGSFGDSVVQIASQGTLGLNNAGDTLTLYDLDSTAVVSYTYGSEGGDDQSLTRDPDITGPDPLVKHSDASGSGGALFSPGTRINGTAFSGCSAKRMVKLRSVSPPHKLMDRHK